MVTKKDFRRVGQYIFEIPTDYRSDMRVPARIYADDDLLEAALGDRSVEQLINTATLPGVVRYTLALPDIHQGYGPPIGGVIATKRPDGVISPGAVGYDINCGVRLLVSNLEAEAVAPYVESLIGALFRNVPSGYGKRGGHGSIGLSSRQMDQVLERGAAWAVSQGYGSRDDLVRTEEQGGMPGADPGAVSRRAKERGATQLGTLGSGNHFVEIQVVEDQTGSWSVPPWIPRRAAPTSGPWLGRPTLPGPTGSVWRIWRGRPLTLNWPASSRTESCAWFTM